VNGRRTATRRQSQIFTHPVAATPALLARMRDRLPRMTRVLLVCMGNICRSPMAQAVLRKMAGARLEADSAGTFPVRLPQGADPRALTVLARRGYVVEKRRPRAVTAPDFERFDLLLAMDGDNLAELRGRCPPGQDGKLRLFLDFAPGLEGQDVPDPYYGDLSGFERVLDLCEVGARGLLEQFERGMPAG
jgi:protein-tyrosine phosphatase